jgi:hypothetical protein
MASPDTIKTIRPHSVGVKRTASGNVTSTPILIVRAAVDPRERQSPDWRVTETLFRRMASADRSANRIARVDEFD